MHSQMKGGAHTFELCNIKLIINSFTPTCTEMLIDCIYFNEIIYSFMQSHVYKLYLFKHLFFIYLRTH